MGSNRGSAKGSILKSKGDTCEQTLGDWRLLDILVGQLHTKGLTNDLKLAAHGLHTYFYETNLNTVDFRMMYAKAQRFYALLQPLL